MCTVWSETFQSGIPSSTAADWWLMTPGRRNARIVAWIRRRWRAIRSSGSGPTE
jgi:hypothetical protein